jgi:hypothetical protein
MNIENGYVDNNIELPYQNMSLVNFQYCLKYSSVEAQLGKYLVVNKPSDKASPLWE